jgi:tetratricopeptide (TPR) repeat protein
MKMHTRIAAALLVTTILAGCGATPEEHLAEARDATAAHQFARARVNLAAVLQEEPTNAAALEIMARTNLAQLDGEGTIAMLDRLDAIGKLPQDSATLYAEGELLAGRFDKALQHAGSVETAEAYRIRALGHVAKGETKAARKAFEQGAAKDGNKSRLFADHARFALSSGNLDKASELANAASVDAGAHLSARLVSAEVALAKGDTASALKNYEVALKDWPESRAALLGKAGVLGELGRREEVQSIVASGLERSPSDLDFVYLKARLAADDGQWEKVRSILQPFENKFGKAARADVLYSQALLELGQDQQARMRLKAVVRNQPHNRAARALLARASLAIGDDAGAAAALAPVAARPDATREELALMAQADPARGGANMTIAQSMASELARGDAAIRAGNWLAAIKAYERILGATDGKNAVVLNNLAFAYGKAGNTGKALVHAEKALAAAPANASILDTAGWLLVETGKDRQRGLALLRKAARLAPNNANIAKHLAEAERS